MIYQGFRYWEKVNHNKLRLQWKSLNTGKLYWNWTRELYLLEREIARQKLSTVTAPKA